MRIHALVVPTPRPERVWCVPSAVAMIHGCTYEEAIINIASLRQDHTAPVSGVYVWEALLVLNHFGYAARAVNLDPIWQKPPTVQQFLDGCPIRERGSLLLLDMGDHVALSHYGMFADNREPKPTKTPQRRGRVLHAWAITEKRISTWVP